MAYHYYLYGLHFASDFELPELTAAPPALEADVIIREGEVADTLPHVTADGVLYQLNPRQFSLELEGVARYLVADGREITIQRLPGSDDGSIRLFLFGSALGALLHQRGLLPLHASSIETPLGAVLFAGASGAGKSTTAAAFHERRGSRVIADDISVVYVENGVPLVRPGSPHMKLWAQSLHMLKKEIGSLRRVRPALEKYSLPIALIDQPCPIHALYILVPHNRDEFTLTPITGMQKLRSLKNHTYRMQYLEGMSKLDMHFSISSVFMQRVKMARLQRPHQGFQLDELIALVEQDLAQ
jgi:hypothetical protein